MNELTRLVLVAAAMLTIVIITSYLYVRRSKASRTVANDVRDSTLPLIRMCFNNQELVIKETQDFGSHWLLKGYITGYDSYSEVSNISFRVPKGIVEVRLGYYMFHNYVLVDTSDPSDPFPIGYLSDTDRVLWDFFPFPKPMF